MAEHTLLEHGRLLILATYTRAYHYYMDQLTENRSLLNWRPGADYIVSYACKLLLHKLLWFKVYDDSSTIKAKALAAVFDSIFQGKINKNEFLQQVLVRFFFISPTLTNSDQFVLETPLAIVWPILALLSRSKCDEHCATKVETTSQTLWL